ncbi:2-keto-4-pentenoate hydratase [Variovorax sp. DT-64]|uniref:2-keto-4-pentenoate hydratase n=1 Tax=Variovorax sp. DT-64 TaxID=3396160 RepID=UPI003F1D4E2F
MTITLNNVAMIASDKIDRAARLLADARRQHQGIPDFPDSLRPLDLDEGYRIQDRVVERVGRPLGGWKIGLTSPAARERYNVRHPIVGQIFDVEIHHSPALLKGLPVMLCLEAELAFRMKTTVQPRPRPFVREELLDHIECVVPVLEICVFHYPSSVGLDVASVVADNSGNAGLVLGQPVFGWRELSFADVKVRVWADDEEVSSGSGQEVMEGDPLQSVLYLANHLRAKGVPLMAGQVVSTGTMHGAPRVSPGARCRADFGPLGEVTFQFRGVESLGVHA